MHPGVGHNVPAPCLCAGGTEMCCISMSTPNWGPLCRLQIRMSVTVTGFLAVDTCSSGGRQATRLTVQNVHTWRVQGTSFQDMKWWQPSRIWCLTRVSTLMHAILSFFKFHFNLTLEPQPDRLQIGNCKQKIRKLIHSAAKSQMKTKWTQDCPVSHRSRAKIKEPFQYCNSLRYQ